MLLALVIFQNNKHIEIIIQKLGLYYTAQHFGGEGVKWKAYEFLKKNQTLDQNFKVSFILRDYL